MRGERDKRTSPRPGKHDGADHHVAEASGSELGDLRIAFADGCVLETFVSQASTGDADEIWRLLPPRSTSVGEPHFVVRVAAIQDH